MYVDMQIWLNVEGMCVCRCFVGKMCKVLVCERVEVGMFCFGICVRRVSVGGVGAS